MAHVVMLGSTGFIGRNAIAASVAAGHQVTAIVRDSAKAHLVKQLGAEAVPGSALGAGDWITRAAGADILVDLAQPPLPARLTTAAVRDVAKKRVAMTTAVCTALLTLPGDERPLLLTASGSDDLLPDSARIITDRSALRTRPRGFAHIGIPVRETITSFVDHFGLAAAFVYFGNVVYGPGKAFLDTLVAGLESGRGRIIGSGDNVLPLTSVRDAAAVIAFLAAQSRATLENHPFVAVPAQSITQRSFLNLTADLLGANRPKSVHPLLAAAVAGRINADVMTLDARARPERLTALGFTFKDTDLRRGLSEALSDIRQRPAASEQR